LSSTNWGVSLWYVSQFSFLANDLDIWLHLVFQKSSVDPEIPVYMDCHWTPLFAS
jgi:hypothetical protein